MSCGFPALHFSSLFLCHLTAHSVPAHLTAWLIKHTGSRRGAMGGRKGSCCSEAMVTWKEGAPGFLRQLLCGSEPAKTLLEMCRSECPVGHLVILILQYFSIRPHLDLALQHPQCWWKARSAGLLPTSQAHHVIRIWNRGRLGPFTPTIFSVCLQD